MSAGILEKLRSIPVIIPKNIIDLREYILSKYTGISFEEKAYILADAVNRIIDNKTPCFEMPLKENLRKSLIKASIEKKSINITSADVFIESIKVKTENESYYLPLCDWINSFIENNIDLDKLIPFIQNIYDCMNTCSISEIELIIDNEYNKTIPSQIRKEHPENNHKASSSFNNTETNLTVVESVYLQYYNDPYKIDKHKKRYIKKLAKLINLEGTIGKAAALAVISVFYLLLMIKLTSFTGMAENKVYTEPPTTKIISTQPELPEEEDAPLRYVLSPDLPENTNVIIHQASENVAPSKTDRKDIKMTNKHNLDGKRKISMKATAYDLSMESCGKPRNHPEYGITKSGTKAVAGRTAAVDPSVIALGSHIYIIFPQKYSHLDGEYIAEDTGRLVKGNIIDIFLGEDKIDESVISKRVHALGIQPVEVYILD